MRKPDAIIRVGADGSAFIATVQDMEKNTNIMANSISARLARMGQAFHGLEVLGGMARGAFTALTAPAAELEDMAAALSIMLGSTEEARALANSLQMLAVNGVVSFGQLEGAARALSNVYGDAGNIEHWVGVLADIAAGSKLPADRLAEMVARFRDMGKAEFTELANAGIPIFEALSEVTGKSKEEVLRLQSVVGGISFEELLKALQLLTEEGGKYHKMNITLSNTTKGSFDTLKGSIAACAAVLGEPINDAMRPILQELSEKLQGMRPELEGLGRALGEFFSNMATIAMPLMSALAYVAEAFTKTERVIGYTAAALLVYAAYANRAAAATVTFSGMVGTAVVRLRAFRLSSIFAGFGGMMGRAKRMWSGFVSGLAMSWKSMCISLAVTFKAAMAAVKAALISTGIGALIWALGEGFSALYSLFAGADEKLKELEASARQFERTMRGLKKQAETVRTEMDVENVLERADEMMEDLFEAEMQARREGDEAAERAAQRQLKAMISWVSQAEVEMEHTLKKVKAEEKRTEQMREQQKLAEETRRAEEQRMKTIEQMATARKDAEFEQEMDRVRGMQKSLGGGSEAVIRARLRRVGAISEEELYKERARLERTYAPSEQQLERYKEVSAAIAKIEEEHRKAQEEQRAKQEENDKRRSNYYDRKSTYKKNRKEEAYEKKSIGAQERYLEKEARLAGYWGKLDRGAIREHLDELARAGAKENEDSIAALERVLHWYDKLEERKRKYRAARVIDEKNMRIQALELAGRKSEADELRGELEVAERIQELREQGASPKQAKRQAEMERKLRVAQELQERVQNARVNYVQGHLAQVGGGGVSLRLGDMQLQESKKQGRLLKEIRDYMRESKNLTAAVLA